MTDDELVERARSGDLAAFEDLVRRYQELAFRTAWIICRHREEAEDAAQEAFVKAYRALPGFRGGAPLRPWLLRIVANEARNRRRGRSRGEALAIRAFERSADHEPTTESLVVARESRADLLRAVETLRDEDRAVVTLRYLLGFSERETAQAVGVRPGTVKSRLSRALGRLRAALDAETVVARAAAESADR